MSLRRNKKQIIHSAKVYLKLGKLLKKEGRGDWGEEQVVHVMGEEISDWEKIRRIEEIDRIIAVSRGIGKEGGGVEEKVGMKDMKDMKELGKVDRWMKIESAGWLRYWFLEHRRIYRYVKRRRTLLRKKLQFSRHPGFEKSLRERYRIVMDLLDPLYQFLEEGWKYLGKREYNLIHNLYRFFCGFLNVWKKEDKYEAWEGWIRLYLVFLVEGQGVKKLEEILRSCGGKILEKVKLEEMILRIEEVLSEEKLGPSLGEYFLSLYMVKMRRYCRYEDWVYSEEEKVARIKRSRYEGGEKFVLKIQSYLREKEREYMQKKRWYKYLRFVDENYGGVAEAGEWYEMIEKVCGMMSGMQVYGVGYLKGWFRNIEDLGEFLLLLMGVYYEIFQEIGEGEVEVILKHGGRVRERVVPYHLEDRWRSLKKNYEDLRGLMMRGFIMGLSYKDYMEGIGDESLRRVIGGVGKDFVDLSMKLYDNFQFEDNLKEKTSLEKLELGKEKDIFEYGVPYRRGKLGMSSYLGGKSVWEGYEMLMRFGVEMGLFLREERLRMNLDLLVSLGEELDRLGEEIERIRA